MLGVSELIEVMLFYCAVFLPIARNHKKKHTHILSLRHRKFIAVFFSSSNCLFLTLSHLPLFRMPLPLFFFPVHFLFLFVSLHLDSNIAV